LKQEGRAKAQEVINYLTNASRKNTPNNPIYFVTGWLEGGFEQTSSSFC
jgi:hypothetical protein